MQNRVKIVIVGNGFGGTYTLKNLHKYLCGNMNVEISMIAENNYFLFTPLLHEVATGSINPLNIVEPMRKILGCCISKFYIGRAKSIDLGRQTVEVGDDVVHYDYLVLATGATTNFFNTKGAEENSFTLKSIRDALVIKKHIIHSVERAALIEDPKIRKQALTFAVVGGGPTGVEFAGELQEFLKDSFAKYYPKSLIDETQVLLIQKGPALLPQFSKKIQDKSLKFLSKKGITVMLEAGVVEVGESHIILDDGNKIDTDMCVWVGGIKPVLPEFLQDIHTAKDGKIMVNTHLQMESHKNVFVLGDAACFLDQETGLPLPALAQVAEKEAKIVAANLYNSITKKPLASLRYKSAGSMVSLGQWMAAGEVGNFSFSGYVTWWIWRTVYLSKLVSFRKKVRVAIDWTINIFANRDISEI